MNRNDLQHIIEDIIRRKIDTFNGESRYREPLIGFAPHDHHLFEKLQPGHLLPCDRLEQARTVIAFYLPFDAEIVRRNRRDGNVTREWAVAYIETNRLIAEICQDLIKNLHDRGIKAIWENPTHNFDPVTLEAKWSHKHVAYICG